MHICPSSWAPAVPLWDKLPSAINTGDAVLGPHDLLAHFSQVKICEFLNLETNMNYPVLEKILCFQKYTLKLSQGKEGSSICGFNDHWLFLRKTLGPFGDSQSQRSLT